MILKLVEWNIVVVYIMINFIFLEENLDLYDLINLNNFKEKN
jgi:hypothetical protein